MARRDKPKHEAKKPKKAKPAQTPKHEGLIIPRPPLGGMPHS